MKFLRWLSGMFAVVLLSSAAFGVVCIEQEIADSPQIVRGVVTCVSLDAAARSRGGTESVTLTITEIIRGPALKQVTVDLPEDWSLSLSLEGPGPVNGP